MSTVALLVNQTGPVVLGELAEDTSARSFGAMMPVTATWQIVVRVSAAAYAAGYAAGQVAGAFLFGGEGGITPTE